MIVIGHGGNTVTRMPEVAKGIEKLDLLVVADPHPTTWAVALRAQERHLSAADLHAVRVLAARARRRTARCSGASRSSSRSSNRRTTTRSCTCSPRSSASPTGCSRTSRSRTTCRVAEDILREINRGGWSTGYCGQSPERLKAHMKNQGKFDLVTLRAPKDGPEVGGDYYGLPWPCWGTPEIKHPGTHTLYNTNLHVKDGGGTFRARFGVERVVKTKVMENGQEVEKETGTICSPKAPTRSARRSRTAIRSSPTACSRSSAGTRTSTATELATIQRVIGGQSGCRVAGRSTCRAASSASALEHGVHPLRQRQGARERVRPARCRSRCIASRSTRRGPIWSPNIRRCRTRASSACPTSASTCRRRRWRRGSPSNSRSSSPPAASSSTKAAARRPAPTSGSPNCSRTCSSRSILRMPPSAASRTAAGSG